VRGETGSGTMGFLAAALACAVSSGLTVIIATVLVADALRSRYGSANMELRLYWIAGGTLAGVLLAGCVGWRLLEPIPSTYRRGGLAMVSAFATVVLMLICTRIFELFGRTGLLTFLVTCAAASGLLAYQARRLKAQVHL
jgi:hypothetical protein